MDMSLWKIDRTIEELLASAVDEETGEISEDAAIQLDTLMVARDEKLEAVGLAYKNKLRFAEAIKAEKQALEKRQKQAERDAEWLKGYMQRSLGGEPFKTPKVAVSYRKTSSVQIYDIDRLPEEYLRYKDPEPDKTAIKKAITDGTEVPGAIVVTDVSMSIK